MYDFLDKIGLKTALEQIKAKFPSSLPANGGNADTVNGHSVNADVPENAVFTDTIVDINTMIYTVAFDSVTWRDSGLGKFYDVIYLSNVSKILSIYLGDWDAFAPDEIVQPFIFSDQQLGIMSNTAKSRGSIKICITYI